LPLHRESPDITRKAANDRVRVVALQIACACVKNRLVRNYILSENPRPVFPIIRIERYAVQDDAIGIARIGESVIKTDGIGCAGRVFGADIDRFALELFALV